MISWMLAIFFLPYIVVPLYFLIGIRKREPKHKKEYVTFDQIGEHIPYILDDPHHAFQNLLKKNGIPPATKGNTFELITDGTEAYDRMLKEIEHAKYSIDICTYVFQFDKMTKCTTRLLIRWRALLCVWVSPRCDSIFAERSKATVNLMTLLASSMTHWPL